MLPNVISDESVTVYSASQGAVTIHKTQPNYEIVLDGIRSGNWAQVEANLTVAQQISSRYADGAITVQDGRVYRHGIPLSNGLTYHILRLLEMKLPIKAEVAFLNKLMRNPSATAVAEFNEFLLASKLPITENGNFRAYKVITRDWLDKHTRTKDNSVGKTVEEPRNTVDDNRKNTCSKGLHFCGYEYAKFFASPGDRLVEVEIDPADVVSFPTDYNTQKGRCCKYVVVRELEMHKDVLTGISTRDFPEPDAEEDYEAHDDYIDRMNYDAEEVAADLNAEYDRGFRDGYEDGYAEAIDDSHVALNNLRGNK